MEEIKKHIKEIKKLCDINRVRSLFLFGSMASNTQTDKSDIDLIVDLLDTDPLNYADHYFSLKQELQILLKRHIDLLEKKAVKNQYLINQIEKTKVLIYAK